MIFIHIFTLHYERSDSMNKDNSIFALRDKSLGDHIKEYRNLKLDNVFAEVRITGVTYLHYSKLLVRYITNSNQTLIYAMGNDLDKIKEGFEENTLRVYNSDAGGILHEGMWVNQIDELESALESSIEERYEDITAEEALREELLLERLEKKIEQVEAYFIKGYGEITFEYVDQTIVDDEFYARYNLLDEDGGIIDIENDVEYIFDADLEEEIDLVDTDYFYMQGDTGTDVYTYHIGLLDDELYIAELDWEQLDEPQPSYEIVIDKDAVEVEVDKTTSVQATLVTTFVDQVSEEDITDKAAYDIGDIATVESGEITGVNIGEDELVVGYKEESTTVQVTVIPNTDPTYEISVDKEDVSIEVGDTESVKVTLHTTIVDDTEDTDITNDATYTIGDIAEVENGVVTGVSEGEDNLSIEYDNMMEIVAVVVNNPPEPEPEPEEGDDDDEGNEGDDEED